MASRSDRLCVIRTVATSLGYSSLKGEQELALEAFTSGKDVFVSLPTGFGKSVCYALLPHVFDLIRGTEKTSIAIVISPLISLMKDQTSIFNKKGVSSVCVSDKEELLKETVHDMMKGKYQLVFMSPESLLLNLQWRRMLCNNTYMTNLIAFVVDEAHCVKKW